MTDVVERFLGQAARAPEAIAVVERGSVVSYAALVDRAAAYARRFGDVGQPRVLIALEKGAHAYAAMLGALMAGGVYAPVNVTSPLARLVHIRDLFDPHLIVAEQLLAADLVAGARAAIVEPAAVSPSAAAMFGVYARDTAPADALAYVIFTSGSTGAPKGVAISHGALAHYVDWLGPALAIGPGDRLSQHPNIGFDLSVLDIFGALCFGASLHPFVERSARLLPARKVREEAITIWNSVPSVITAMETAGELDAAHLASVRLFTFCGEVLRRDQVARLFAARPDTVVLNTYGPTEATVAMTCRRLTADTFERLCSESAPLGEAIGNMRLDVVGEGEEGEMVISGPQLAAGYWGDSELTASKFREATTPAGPVRVFHTGDHVKRVDGELYFLGRADDMVKLRGHRIHLGEISRVLDGLGWGPSHVFEADGAIHAVIERQSDQTDDQTFDESAVRAAIAGQLDSHFVPATIRYVARFPRTANDKIDTAALRAGMAVRLEAK